jgi:hypothetical protein
MPSSTNTLAQKSEHEETEELRLLGCNAVWLL